MTDSIRQILSWISYSSLLSVFRKPELSLFSRQPGMPTAKETMFFRLRSHFTTVLANIYAAEVSLSKSLKPNSDL